jgi:NAD/NADP transhydrogenase alpha subunit
MKAGSVIVDLAGETGGNCELTEPGQVIVAHDVTIVSPLNLPASMPEHASALYARNVQALVELMLDTDASPPRSARLRGRDHRRGVHHPRRPGRPRAARADRGGPGLMLLENLAILVLAGFVGYAVISKVPNTLHTPLMSGTNAIHGIVILGGIILLAAARWTTRSRRSCCSSR